MVVLPPQPIPQLFGFVVGHPTDSKIRPAGNVSLREPAPILSREQPKAGPRSGRAVAGVRVGFDKLGGGGSVFSIGPNTGLCKYKRYKDGG